MQPPAAVKIRGVDDLISGLPDELLHIILLRLPTIAAAARTSVLSRRWRRVWTYLPELDLGGSPVPATTSSAAARLLDSIDAVVKAYSAPTLHRLKIVVSKETDLCDVPARRVAEWLRFASQCLTGRLYIHLPYLDQQSPGAREELPLPVFERATEIAIDAGLNFVLRPPPTGSFAALTVLTIGSIEVDRGELGRLVSTQCPRLQKLHLVYICFVAACDASILSIRSESLECLEYYSGGVDKGELEVTAPMLLEISVGRAPKSYIVAPKLEKVVWKSNYNPGHHQFAVAPRHLRSLSIMYSTWLSLLISSTPLVQRFDTVIKLTVSLAIHEGIEGYMSFLMEMDKLPAYCPCILPDSCQLDDTTFESLEEIGIKFFTGSTEEEMFLKLLLSRCNLVTLKRVNLTVPSVPVPSQITEVIERIHSTCHPKTNVQFNVFSVEAPKPLA